MGRLKAARNAVAATGGIMALTRSEKGCVVLREDELHVLDAAPVERVIDTTGAGAISSRLIFPASRTASS